MSRSTTALLICLWATAACLADVVIVKDRSGKPRIHGIKDKVDDIEVTVDNVETLLDNSTGVIEVDSYDGITIKRTEKSRKGDTFDPDEVIRVYYSSEPPALLDGFTAMQTGAWAQAISSFLQTYNNKEERTVYRLDAFYQIGICYVQMGNLKRATDHFSKWPGQKSKYTPEVHRLLAEIYTAQKQFGNARGEYAKIAALPDITDKWKRQAALGGVKVDIAERKYDEAEQAAKRIASAAGSDARLADAHALALALQASAIFESGNIERLGEAEKLLTKAAGVEGASASTRAMLHTTLGHVLYAQKNPTDARFAYLRVVCLTPGERSFVASSLQNAGQCFLDLSMRPEIEGKPESDDLFMKGMRLLAECGRNYRGLEAATKAAAVYRQHKTRYDTLRAASGESDEGDKDEG